MASRRVGPHPRRDRIVAVLFEHPGIGYRELMRRTAIPSGSLHHHVTILIRQGRAWTVGLSPRLLHYAGPRPFSEVEVRSAVVHHALDAVDRELVEATALPVNQKTLLERFAGRVPGSTVQARLYALTRRGLMTQKRCGRYVNYEALPVSRRAADTPGGVPTDAGSVVRECLPTFQREEPRRLAQAAAQLPPRNSCSKTVSTVAHAAK